MKYVFFIFLLLFAITTAYSQSYELDTDSINGIIQQTKVNTYFRNLLLETADTNGDANFDPTEINTAFCDYRDEIISNMQSTEAARDRFLLLYDRNENDSLEDTEFINAWFNLDGCIRYRRSFGSRVLKYEAPTLKNTNMEVQQRRK